MSITAAEKMTLSVSIMDDYMPMLGVVQLCRLLTGVYTHKRMS